MEANPAAIKYVFFIWFLQPFAGNTLPGLPVLVCLQSEEYVSESGSSVAWQTQQKNNARLFQNRFQDAHRRAIAPAESA
jgi:hypothetical protein